MSYRYTRDVVTALQCANELQELTWRWWLYSAESRTLVLAAQPCASPGSGYLVLRAPTYARLPFRFVGAEFTVGPPATSEENPCPSVDVSASHLLCVSIRAEGRVFTVVCEGVVFCGFEASRGNNVHEASGPDC
jgi:hypothetical protein